LVEDAAQRVSGVGKLKFGEVATQLLIDARRRRRYHRSGGGVAFTILHSRMIVGWSASAAKDTAFVKVWSKKPLWRRDHVGHKGQPGITHHLDAGWRLICVGAGPRICCRT
jgi:hypothetical protein